MQNILQYSDMGVHVIDKDRKTIIYNEVMAKLEGLESNQVIGKDLLAIFPSLNQQTSTLIKVLQGEASILNRTQIYLNFKGEKITTINSTIPLIYNGKIVGALEIAKDISNIRNLSDQLIDLQSKLKLYNTNQSIDKKNQKYRIKRYSFSDIIGEDGGISLLKGIAKKASNSTSSVLIYGDTGTGKELFAQSIHYGGIRNNKPFIAQNCAAIPESLLEGILFGTEKGGFTGAIASFGVRLVQPLFQRPEALLIGFLHLLYFFANLRDIRILGQGRAGKCERDRHGDQLPFEHVSSPLYTKGTPQPGSPIATKLCQRRTGGAREGGVKVGCAMCQTAGGGASHWKNPAAAMVGCAVHPPANRLPNAAWKTHSSAWDEGNSSSPSCAAPA